MITALGGVTGAVLGAFVGRRLRGNRQIFSLDMAVQVWQLVGWKAQRLASLQSALNRYFLPVFYGYGGGLLGLLVGAAVSALVSGGAK